MRELTKTERKGEGARGQKVRENDRRRRDICGSDQESKKVSQEKVRTRSRLQKVDNLTGASLVPGGPRNANERGEVVVKSEPMSAPPKSKLVSARGNHGKRRSKIIVKKVHCGEILVKKKKFTDSEEEDKRRDKKNKFEKKVSKKPKKDSSSEESSEESENDSSNSKKEDKKESRKKRVRSPRGNRKSFLPERYNGTTPLTIFWTQFESCARYNK